MRRSSVSGSLRDVRWYMIVMVLHLYRLYRGQGQSEGFAGKEIDTAFREPLFVFLMTTTNNDVKQAFTVLQYFFKKRQLELKCTPWGDRLFLSLERK